MCKLKDDCNFRAYKIKSRGAYYIHAHFSTGRILRTEVHNCHTFIAISLPMQAFLNSGDLGDSKYVKVLRISAQYKPYLEFRHAE